MAYPRFQRARAFKFSIRTAGDLTLNSTSWANVDTGLDITLNCQVGDVVEVNACGLWGGEAVGGRLSVATIVSAAVVNRVGGTNGVAAWFGVDNYMSNFGAPYFYTVQAADISSGVVLLRLQYATNSATNKTLYAGTAYPLLFSAKNLGPVDPS